jgi:hypothetical protein
MLMVGIHTGYLISFIQIQPIQNHWWNFGKYDNLKNVNSFSTITGKKLMQPIKYKHVLMCFIYITSILTSPSVEMYVHQTPFNQM